MGTRPVDALASEMMRPAFWLAALQIMWINILLSGDNAVVIALACRGLPPQASGSGAWCSAPASRPSC